MFISLNIIKYLLFATAMEKISLKIYGFNGYYRIQEESD